MTTSTPRRARAGTLMARIQARCPSETALAHLALGVLGLHVVDDSFLRPETGTSAADHLVSGLLPVAVIAAAATLYGRARAGFRAVLALAFGSFGIAVGIEALYFAMNSAGSADSLTSWLSLAAGILLVALGAATSWRTRRTDDRLGHRYARRALVTIVGAVAVYSVLLPILLAYVVTHTGRAHVPSPSLGAPVQDVAFRTSDGLLLQGWYVPSRNGATVIAFPGRSGPQKQARVLIDHGYGVLLFDRRGEGTSEGDPNAFGWGGERDLLAAAAYLRSRPDVDGSRIGAIGLSVGGEMLIHAAAHSDAFQAIITEGATGQSVRDTVANPELSSQLLDLPTQMMLTTALTVFAHETPPPSLRSEVARIAPTSVLFIYGELGQGGTETSPNQAFYGAAHEPKEVWEVAQGQHIAGITTRPKAYERRIIEFLDRSLLDGPRPRPQEGSPDISASNFGNVSDRPSTR
jgi:hypothetical protein